MLAVEIPGFGALRLEHLVLDYNGTLALDGEPLPGVRDALCALASSLTIHVLTADTFGKAGSRLQGLPCRRSVLDAANQDAAKQAYVEALGPATVVCIGNGRNDRLMLEAAALGIAVVQEEGAAVEALTSADVVAPSIAAALALLTNPLRLVATLRS